MENQPSEQGTVRYIRCPSCGTPNPATGETCSRCNKPLKAGGKSAAAQPVVCPKCRNTLPPGSKFCGFCGSPLPVAPAAPATPSPAPAKPAAPAASPKLDSSSDKIVTPPRTPPPAAPAPSRPASQAGNPEHPLSKSSPAISGVGKVKSGVTPPPGSLPERTVAMRPSGAPRIAASIAEVKQDGTTGKAVNFTKEIFIGRANCDVSYPSDQLLSPRHASLTIQEGKATLKDQQSQNGTFLKQRQDAELKPGDVFLLGRELFRFTTQSLDDTQPPASPQGTMVIKGAPKLQRGPITAKLEHIQPLTGELIEEFSLDKPEVTLGRAKGDLIFKNDPYMSGVHAKVVAQPGRFVLVDLKSTNGIYRKIRGQTDLVDGDEFFLGEQRFRISIRPL